MNEEFIFRVGADVTGFTKSISQVEAGLSKLPKAVNDGAASLNALGQVARDAPFGFIAIQNNLPILFDQLGTLSARSGGAANALKAIGTSLIGPAGVTFAIGAAISVITVLVQKYGSVGAALDAIITKQSRYSEEILEANKSYEKFNKEKRDSIEISAQEVASIEGSISKVSALGAIVTDQTKSYNERNAALNNLKSISKEYFGNLDIEKTKINDLSQAVAAYISSIKQAAITKGFEGAIGETSVELAKQIKLLDNLKNELDDAKAAPVKFIGKADQVDTRDIDAATARFNAQNKVVTSLRGDIALYNTEIDKSVKAQNSLQAPIDAANKKFKDTQNLTKKQVGIDKKSKSTKEQNAKEDLKNQEELNASILRGQKLALEFRSEYDKEQSIKNKAKEVERLTLEYKKLEAATFAQADIEMNQDALANNPLPSLTKSLEPIGKEADLSTALQLAKNTFFNPISDLFENFLTTGKFAFKDFAKAVLQAISQVVAKVIATGIISLLFTIFTGGFGAGAGGAAGGLKTVLGAITSSLGFGGAKSVAAPSFAGVSGGGMEMGGAVNLTLRGSDLVGSINRTNSTINRVG